ncbi:hypothetical protein SRABI70_04529 [Pseudomonas sp. Bi70]|nr:hypothetical protein SRABI70_04529 [Pseudomonas sp. Bi70]
MAWPAETSLAMKLSELLEWKASDGALPPLSQFSTTEYRVEGAEWLTMGWPAACSGRNGSASMASCGEATHWKVIQPMKMSVTSSRVAGLVSSARSSSWSLSLRLSTAPTSMVISRVISGKCALISAITAVNPTIAEHSSAPRRSRRCCFCLAANCSSFTLLLSASSAWRRAMWPSAVRVMRCLLRSNNLTLSSDSISRMREEMAGWVR